MGIAAAEIAVKEHISVQIPEAEWLVQRLPSPPIYTILKDFIPRMNCPALPHGYPRRMPKALLEEIRKAVTVRNDLVHVGASPGLDWHRVKRFLSTFGDLLCSLDVFSGRTWVFRHLHVDLQRFFKSGGTFDPDEIDWDATPRAYW